MSLCIMGVDPGLSGAVAFYFPGAPGHVSAEDSPIVGGDLDVATIAGQIKQMKPDVAIIERVGAMPKQGVASTFKFGASYGALIGVVAALGVPYQLVTPTKWKRHFSLCADKEAARALALRTWPARAELFYRKKDHGRAEAALLARYGAETWKGGAP